MKRFFLLAAVLILVNNAWAQTRSKQLASAAPQLEQGAVNAGKRVGKWSFYNRQGELELTFDYDSSRIKFLQPDTTRYLVRVGEQWQPKALARPPHFLGSTDQHLQDLNGKLHYPVSALRQQLQGTVLLSYTVDVNGHTRDYSIEHSLSPDCDQEVWKVLKELPDNWIPAIYLGRPTPARFYLAVQFQMMDEADFNRQKRDQKKAAQQRAGASPALSPGSSKPHYTHEVFVTAVAIEHTSR